MNIQFFDDPNHIPKPNNQVKIEDLKVIPYPDRFRVRVEIKVTPFQERPNLILVARDKSGLVVADLDIIATMHSDMEFTMHIRKVDDPAGGYTLSGELYYESRNPPQDTRTVSFVIPEATQEDEA